jgi:coenzyme F420 hydrogenase subunit beta
MTKSSNVNNIVYTLKNHICTGCGICEDVCPKQAITIVRTKGEHRPALDPTLCLGNKCGRCLKVCPGVGVNLASIAKERFTDAQVQEDKYIGRYVALHTGYSLDEDIRYHSASGGMVSQFLIYLLDKKLIDGAVVTGYGDDHISPMSYIARTAEEVINARSSKYCPVALNKVGNEIARIGGGKYVIVGLPCHIQGFRKRAAIDRKFREHVVGMFSIYCSSNRTFYGQDWLFRHYGVEKKDIKYFAYRDEGCLGKLTILHGGKGEEFPSPRTMKTSTRCRESESLKKISIPYTSYYGPLLRSFFKPHRCLMCIDHYGELADVCFGDIHIEPYNQDEVGISSWITRTAYWEEQFQQAAKEGYIHMDDVPAKVLNDSQSTMLYPKKRRAQAVANIDRLLGRKSPVYDKAFEKPRLKDYISEVVCLAQQFVGKRKYLWFLIDLINKGK